MKNKMFTTMLVAVFATLFLADAASAYYSPRMGRFLNRDPIEEPGAVLVRQAARTATGFVPRDSEDSLHNNNRIRYGMTLGKSTCGIFSSSYIGSLPAWSEDPAYKQQELNLYQYAIGAPTNHVDPLGLSTKCGIRFCLCCGKGTRRVNVYGDSARAKAIIEAGFGKGAQGCVTLLNWFSTGAEIYCTMSCQAVKNAYTPGGIRILDHECCHACDYFDHGEGKYLEGAINDDCDMRPRGGGEMW